MSIHFALLASATLIGAPAAANPVTGAEPQAELAPHYGQQCETGEELVFAGDVQDDFGLGIAVCLSGETITIRYSGEGDPQSVSCPIAECEGVIDFSHYVRYRFTVMTLTWRDANGEQTLTESYNAQVLAEEPFQTVSHTWVPAEQEAAGAEPEVYRVLAHTKPLSMVALAYLDWP